MLAILVSVLASCGAGNSNQGTITIVPEGGRVLTDIKIQKCEILETGAIACLDSNYADPTAIDSSTSYSVDPGSYYVYFNYMNLGTGSSGWWQTTKDALIAVNKGEEWVISYGYSGATVKQK